MPVTLHGVGHAFGDGAPLFTDVDLTLHRGSVCAIVGPSGSGKSTLLAVVAGMVTPRFGQVARAAGTRVGWVFQNPHGVPRRTALDHVSLAFVADGASRVVADRRARALLDRFDLTPRVGARFAELSGGEAQRLMLARGIAAEPDVLLVDEPTAQLDRRTAAEVNRVIGSLADHGTAVLVATHDDATRDACDDVLDLGEHR